MLSDKCIPAIMPNDAEYPLKSCIETHHHCSQVNSHQAAGMMALYNITGQQPEYPINGTIRTYYIQAVCVVTAPINVSVRTCRQS